jgi:hypothetical protein
MAQSSSTAQNGFNSSGGIGLTSSGIMEIAAVVGAIALLGFVLWFAFKKGK